MGLRAVEEALVEVGLEEVLEQLLLPVAAPLAPSERETKWENKKNYFLSPRVDFLNSIFSIEKLINILNINERDY